MVRVHQIPLEEVAAAGVSVPTTARAAHTQLHRDRHRRYIALKSRPEPLIEFVSRWLARNVPAHRDRACLIPKDAGQFLVHNGRVSALYDLEIAHVSDPQADLAGMRVRSAFEPLGDLAYVFARYTE